MREYIATGTALGGFMIALQFSQLLFAWKEQRRDKFYFKLVIAEVLYLLLGFFILIGVQNKLFLAQYVGMYFVVFICSYLVITACFQISQIEVVFVTSCGYALQHIADSVFQILSFFLFQNKLSLFSETMIRMLVQSICAVIIYFSIIRKNEYLGERKEKDPRMVSLAILILFAAICLSIWGTPTGNEQSQTALFFGSVICRLYAIICCLLVICMEYAVSWMNLIKKQNDLMEQVIHAQGNQLELSKESVSIINRKCHDIKYQMKALKLMNDVEQRKERVEELQKAISIYDSIYHTGNEVINFILREKAMLCEEYGILFSCLADGSGFDFMATDDLYVLLGNSFDNAIESVMNEQDEEKRIISIRIGNQKGMYFIHVENYCREKLTFHKGLPVSTKQDKNNHGFGTQSIQYLVDKYYGNLSIQNMEDMFYLDMGFPTT